MGVEWQVSQPEADKINSPQDANAAAVRVSWDGSEQGWSQGNNNNCRLVGDTLVCDADIYGNGYTPKTYADAFRAIIPLAKELGLLPQNQVYRISDTQPAPYYPPGTYAIPSGTPVEQPVVPYYDQFDYHQQGPDSPYRPLPAGPQNFDPLSFHQNDKTTPALPPWKPVVVADIPLPPIPPKPAEQPKPGDPKPGPVKQPGEPGNNPCRPCRPRDGGCGWYPGKIAGRVVGRIFGGGRRCR